jgi:hypothetical protein
MIQAQERDECMWELAYRLARSGGHRSYQSIESELSGLGYGKAHSLLDDETARTVGSHVRRSSESIRIHKRLEVLSP